MFIIFSAKAFSKRMFDASKRFFAAAKHKNAPLILLQPKNPGLKTNLFPVKSDFAESVGRVKK